MSTAEACTVDTGKATYTASVSGLVIANAGTDFFTITGAVNKKIKVIRLEFSGIATAAAAVIITLIKRSTPNTGGTATTRTAVAHEAITGLSAAALVQSYTANPTLGQIVGAMQTKRGVLNTAAAGANAPVLAFEFDKPGIKFPTLNSDQEVLALNFNAQTAAGNACEVVVTWTEE